MNLCSPLDLRQFNSFDDSIFIWMNISLIFLFVFPGRRVLRGREVRLRGAGRAGAGPAQERALPAAGRLQALVARAERAQPVRLRAQQLRQEGEAFVV